jgi:site-specific DNA-methyltransferase (adenine-specific)
VDLDPTESQLLALADNKIGEIADWDQDLLSEVLTDLKDADLSGIGFSDSELDELIQEAQVDQLDNVIEGDLDDQDWDQIPSESVKIAKTGGVYQIGGQQVACGDCVEVMRSLPDNSIDSIVTDPPYGIGFMGKGWDHSVPSEEWARECLRVLKDGGHLICFAATRTVHRLAVAVEDAGFEIRDQLGWCYYSGFPKSMDISKQIDKMAGAEREVVFDGFTSSADQGRTYSKGLNANFQQRQITKPTTKEAKYWQGWGTALKPAYEPCVLARKPIAEKNVASQVLKTGTGAINIDACRFGYGDPCWIGPQSENTTRTFNNDKGIFGSEYQRSQGYRPDWHRSDVKNMLSAGSEKGRWPANLYQCPKPPRSEREEGLTDLVAKIPPAVQHQKDTKPNKWEKGINDPRAGTGRTAGEVKN